MRRASFIDEGDVDVMDERSIIDESVHTPFMPFDGVGCGFGNGVGENEEGQGESSCGDGKRGDGECTEIGA